MRIWVRGSTGSGKSTLAAALADRFGLRHIELDDLWWLPNWKQRSLVEFAELVDEATAGDAWVMTGNYRQGTEPLVYARCDLIIWLDYSFPLTMGRLLGRTLRRIVKKELCCNGNRERAWVHLTRDGLPWFLILTYRRRRRQCDELMADPGLAHIRRIRLKHPREAVQAMAQIEFPHKDT